MIAATPAATAPASINPFLTVLELPAFPLEAAGLALALALALELDPVALAELLGEPLLAAKAPNTPPCTFAGDEPWALAAADLYAARVFPLAGGLTTKAMPASQ